MIKEETESKHNCAQYPNLYNFEQIRKKSVFDARFIFEGRKNNTLTCTMLYA